MRGQQGVHQEMPLTVKIRGQKPCHLVGSLTYLNLSGLIEKGNLNPIKRYELFVVESNMLKG